MSPEPEFYIKPRDEKADQFLVLACDGVWDVMSNEDICNFITHRMKVHDNLETICNEVIYTCLYNRNISTFRFRPENLEILGIRTSEGLKLF